MRVTVFGSARLGEKTPEYGQARDLGRLLSGRGHTVLTGGYGGLMEAVSRGVHEMGGKTIGVTMASWSERLSANRYLGEERAARSLFHRIELLVESEALIALPGGAGTLGEVALAWNLSQMEVGMRKPIILVGPNWRAMVENIAQLLVVNPEDIALLSSVTSVEDAVATIESFDRYGSERWFG